MLTPFQNTVPLVDYLARGHEEYMPLDFLKGFRIGVDAQYFLEQYLSDNRETLLPALGGTPLLTGPRLKEYLANITSTGVALHFVFNGLDYGLQMSPFAASQEAAKKHDKAFRIYEENKAQEACEIFKTSGRTHTLFVQNAS